MEIRRIQFIVGGYKNDPGRKGREEESIRDGENADTALIKARKKDNTVVCGGEENACVAYLV
jgi:hypothetical protein